MNNTILFTIIFSISAILSFSLVYSIESNDIIAYSTEYYTQATTGEIILSEDFDSNRDDSFEIFIVNSQVPGVGKAIIIKMVGAKQTVTFEIISSDEEIIETLSFVASNQGDISLPWLIPKDMEPGIYTIYATDAFNSDCVRFDLDTLMTDTNCVSEKPILCDKSYPDVCIIPYPPDLNCGDIGYANFRVIGNDPHRFDADNDGIGCES